LRGRTVADEAEALKPHAHELGTERLLAEPSTVDRAHRGGALPLHRRRARRHPGLAGDVPIADEILQYGVMLTRCAGLHVGLHHRVELFLPLLALLLLSVALLLRLLLDVLALLGEERR